MVDERVHGQRRLAHQLGVSVGHVSNLKRLGVIVELDGGFWDVDACRRALAAYRRGETRPSPAVSAPPASTVGAPQAPPEPPAVMPIVPTALTGGAPALPPPLKNELVARRLESELASAGAAVSDSDLDKVLRTSTDLLELASAGALKAARAYVARPDESTAKTYQASLDVLRKAKNDDLEYRQKTGDLIDRDVAKACVGEAGRGFVLACSRFGVRIASQYEIWRADPVLNALSADERGRQIQAWTEKMTDQARIAETEDLRAVEIERRVAAEIASRMKAKKREQLA